MSNPRSKDGSVLGKGISGSMLDGIGGSDDFKHSEYQCTRRQFKQNADSHRKGPAPLDDQGLCKKCNIYAVNTLDSDLEDVNLEDEPLDKKNKEQKKYSVASCRQLIIYFSKISKAKNEDEMIDLSFVESLLQNGGDINFSDKHGQTILHEIASAWHVDVAKFAIDRDADYDKSDSFGRTPLHLAAAVNYTEMVEFLVDKGANYDIRTDGENQTPLHYAAKNNAVEAMKTLLKLGANLNVRDYKDRTPLFVAAENARAESARFLIEQGAPCGIYDSSGTTCLSLMIEKMPNVALEAMEQFQIIDRAFRKHYYYLSYLEPDPKFLPEELPEEKSQLKDFQKRKREEKKERKETGQKNQKKLKSYAKTPLEVIIQYHQLDLIMHPVIQRLIHVKWHLFGKWGSARLLSINLYYTLIWTLLGVWLVPEKDTNYYTPLDKNWWRIALELQGVGLTLYFMLMELQQIRNNESVHNRWTHWKTRHMEKDLQFCHPRREEEKKYISAELEEIRSYHRTYFRDTWNIFEWVSYVVVLSLVITRMLTVIEGGHSNNTKNFDRIHCRLYALGLIILWLRFMRSCRVFRTLGPFIAILGDIISDTTKFTFLFFEFFIPYTVAFWILFGGNRTGGNKEREQPHADWDSFNDLVFSVWTMTLGGTYDWESLVAADRLMAQILSGSYIALASVVCLNLYIALLSDTFARIYAEAQANAYMQQATTIIMLEGKLNKLKTSKCAHYMQTECSPQICFDQDDGTAGESVSEDPSDRISRQIVSRIDECQESATEMITTKIDQAGIGGGGNNQRDLIDNKTNIALFMREQAYFQKEMKKQVEEMMKMLKDLQMGRGLLMNHMTYQPGASDIDSAPGSPLIRMSSSDADDESSVPSGSIRGGSPAPLIAKALQKKLSSVRDNAKGSPTPSFKGSGDIPKINPESKKRPEVPQRPILPKRSEHPKSPEIPKHSEVLKRPEVPIRPNLPKIQFPGQVPQSIQNSLRSIAQGGSIGIKESNVEKQVDGEEDHLEENRGPPQSTRRNQPSAPPKDDMESGSSVHFYPAIHLTHGTESELQLLPSMPNLNSQMESDFEEHSL